MVTAVALLLLLNDKCKLESLQRDGRPGWRFPQTAGCKARTCFIAHMSGSRKRKKATANADALRAVIEKMKPITQL